MEQVIDERLVMVQWGARPLPKRLGGVWCSKIRRQQDPVEKAKAAARKRVRYAENRERERAKARDRYHADPHCLARKLRANMTFRQRVRAANADRRKYAKDPEKYRRLQRERVAARKIATAILIDVLERIEVMA